MAAAGRRWLRRGAALLVLVAAAAWGSLAPRDPAGFPAAGGPVAVRVLDHGWHAGLVMATADLRAAAVRLARARPDLADRLRRLAGAWPRAQALEIGWGDAAFYRATPALGDLQPGLALRAALWPTPSVLQAVPVRLPAEAAFPRTPGITLRLSEAGFARLAARLAETLATGPDGGLRPLGPSLYGQGAFLAAVPSYHGLRTCNHWVSGLLRAGGVPSSWAFSATSAGLMAELRWRL
ncbi:DUF2459 domain-containing protein [Paralimibaculum aggregatum]|uniref:DUF2459 domain-containing protein n=1 Tax=Paralimibaculum aggregatum TaxID=3036245 RepID=A0ABQ6LNJ6_9RHOB|nr:DUF2459 domain-containing protein [Limibaculum sp. NKW23]GMG84738.1 DUF2459 domain-containing protein [Limibaculum sp. NKW23]